jgi:hypothetical protein
MGRVALQEDWKAVLAKEAEMQSGGADSGGSAEWLSAQQTGDGLGTRSGPGASVVDEAYQDGAFPDEAFPNEAFPNSSAAGASLRSDRVEVKLASQQLLEDAGRGPSASLVGGELAQAQLSRSVAKGNALSLSHAPGTPQNPARAVEAEGGDRKNQSIPDLPILGLEDQGSYSFAQRGSRAAMRGESRTHAVPDRVPDLGHPKGTSVGDARAVSSPSIHAAYAASGMGNPGASGKITAEPLQAREQLQDSEPKKERSVESAPKIEESVGQPLMPPAGFFSLDAVMGMQLAAVPSPASSRPLMAASGIQEANGQHFQSFGLSGAVSDLAVLVRGTQEAQGVPRVGAPGSDFILAPAEGPPAIPIGLHEAPVLSGAAPQVDASRTSQVSQVWTEHSREASAQPLARPEISTDAQEGIPSTTPIMPGRPTAADSVATPAVNEQMSEQTSVLTNAGKSSAVRVGAVSMGEATSSARLSTLGQIRQNHATLPMASTELGVLLPLSSEAGAGSNYIGTRDVPALQRQPELASPFQVMDASGAAGSPVGSLRTTAGTATLAAGYQDAALGYVELKASLGASGIHASLAAATPEAGLVLQGHLHALSDWLGERHTPVESLSVLGGAAEFSQREGSRSGSSPDGFEGNGFGGKSGGFTSGGSADGGTGGGEAERGSYVASSFGVYSQPSAVAAQKLPEPKLPEIAASSVGPDSTWSAGVDRGRISVMA